MTAKKETDAPKPAKSVKYIGSSDLRIISGTAWQSLGIKDQEQVVWGAGAKRTVPAADLTEEAIAWLDAQKDFQVVR